MHGAAPGVAVVAADLHVVGAGGEVGPEVPGAESVPTAVIAITVAAAVSVPVWYRTFWPTARFVPSSVSFAGVGSAAAL